LNEIVELFNDKLVELATKLNFLFHDGAFHEVVVMINGDQTEIMGGV
jgi:hypothetical protein